MGEACVHHFQPILTLNGGRRSRSGQRESAPAGSHVLRELQRSQRSGGPDILPGAGINPGTIRHILDQLLPHGLKEVHLSGGRWVDGEMVYRPGGMGMGASTETEWRVWVTDGDVIRAVRAAGANSAISV